jgi:hypothetical protein
VLLVNADGVNILGGSVQEFEKRVLRWGVEKTT